MPAKDIMKRVDIVTNNGGGGSGSYTETATFFFGNATIEDIGGGNYGFNLGQIEGLDSSVEEIGYIVDVGDSIYQGGLAYTYNETWIGSLLELYNTPHGYCLSVSSLTASDVGKIATITLQSEEDVPTSDFKSAVKKSIEPIQIDMPGIVFEKIQLALGQYATNVVSNAGKICTVPDIEISYLEYADAEEQAKFKSFSIAIANAATLNRETSVYFNGYLVTERQEVRSGDSTIGGSISVSFESKTGGMRFNLSMKIIGFYDGDTIRTKIDVVYPVVLS